MVTRGRHSVYSPVLAALLGCTFLMIGGEPAGAAPKDEVTVGFDCAGWNRLARELPEGVLLLGKVAFVQGLFEGLAIGGSPDLNKFHRATTTEHLSRLADQFCSDPRNEHVWLYLALQVVSLEIRGAPKEEIERAIADARRLGSMAREIFKQ